LAHAALHHPSLDVKGARAGHRVLGVSRQLQHRAFDVLRLHPNLISRAIVRELDGDLRAKLLAQRGQASAQESADLDTVERWLPLRVDKRQPLSIRTAGDHRVADTLDAPMSRVPVGKLLFEQGDIAQYRGQQAGKVSGDTDGEGLELRQPRRGIRGTRRAPVP
jgi:hypothetical protein